PPPAPSSSSATTSVPAPRPASTSCYGTKARWDQVESPSCFSLLIEHDLFGKPVSTFPDHAHSNPTPLSPTNGRERRGRALTYIWLLFSFRGRINRARYLVVQLALLTFWLLWLKFLFQF